MNSVRDDLPMKPELKATEECDQIIREHLEWQNELEFGLGDTLDIKTSIILVVIVFLAEQSEKLLSSPMPQHWHVFQIASVVCLIVAGILAVLELIPRTYGAGLSPAKFLEWLNGVKAFYGVESNPETKTVAFIRRKQLEQMRTRFSTNRNINKVKARFVEWSFYFTIAALGINLATLAALSAHWRF